MEEIDIPSIINRAVHFLEGKGYESYDQFDALCSPLIGFLTRPSDFLRRVAIQINKNIPINVRPVLGYRPMIHTKTVSDMLSVYAYLYSSTSQVRWKDKARKMYDLLMARSLDFDRGVGWGLNFPYTTRFTNAASKTPNLYNTLNAGHALLDGYSLLDSADIQSTIRSIVSFMFDYLGVVEIDKSTMWFRYYPNQKIPNFNVNATAASFFLRANRSLGDPIVPSEIIDGLLNLLMKYQNHDGSWYYTPSENGKWIDGYHTGFILDALLYLQEVGYDYPLQAPLKKAIEFYVRELFTTEGIPKFYSHRLYPIEAQNCAQAIQTLSKCVIQGQFCDKHFLQKVVHQTITHLYDPSGYFYYKKDRLWTNRQFYSRWSHTPMILAMIYYKQLGGS